MEARILWNDLKGSPMLAVTTWLFMAISAFLFALTCFLAIGLLGSVDTLMETAQTPDFLQMHTGQIDEAALVQFAQQQEQVQDYQTLRFLNLENSSITLGGNSLSDSTQDNGVCVQSGEIYVPVCYRQKYGLNVGETVQIGDFDFTIAGFLRDSQMNAMMASSKRFLVSESDYLLLKNAGSEESLIEFLLREDADVNAFATAYTDAGLPANGPAITKPLIRMMNALSDGLMVLVILLVSVVLLLISMLCIRSTLLTQLEADRREIGMLKAIGMPGKEIRMAAWAAVLAAAVVMFVVTFLFTRLLVAEDRNGISLRKALGFTLGDIKGLYFHRFLPVLLAGILTGILTGNLLGQQLAGLFLKTLGATGFRFRIDYPAVCGWIPGIAAVTVLCGGLLGLMQIKHIRAYECCMGKE